MRIRAHTHLISGMCNYTSLTWSAPLLKPLCHAGPLVESICNRKPRYEPHLQFFLHAAQRKVSAHCGPAFADTPVMCVALKQVADI